MPRKIFDTSMQIRNGTISPVDVVEACLARIDAQESAVRAWVMVDRERAREDAERFALEAQRGQWRGPLHGIPLGVKDIFDVFDWPTAAGSKCWANAIARHDALVVDRLRRAGAIFLGKTVTTAYASFDPPPTRNPWNHDRTPGGSSSGSAAAVACGMCFGALASQTGGSITRPAGYCGVPSLKPSYGRVGLSGVVPLAPSLDHAGVMAGSVHDLAIVFQAMHGPDRAVEHAIPSLPDLLRAIEEGADLPDIGRLRGFFDERADPEMTTALDRICEMLRENDIMVRDLALPPEFAEVIPRHRTIMAVEAAAYHEPRYRKHPDDYPPRVASLIEEGLSTPAPEYARCREHQRILMEAMRGLFDDVSVLLTPATTGPAPDAATTGDPAFNSPWSYTGLPTISLPFAWSSDGLPLSLQLIGPMFEEAELFAIAGQVEDIVAWQPRTLR